MKSLKRWLNKVFCQNDTPDTYEASLNASVEVINTSDTDGIGEPMLSFIETYRSGRKRFEVSMHEWRLHFRTCQFDIVYFVVDTKTNQKFNFLHEVRPCTQYTLTSGEWEGEYTNSLDCFSGIELEYLFETLIKPEHAKYIRLENIRYLRKKRLQREQLMEVYCNEI